MAKVSTTLFGTLALLPAQAQRPVREVLEWLTDLQQSKNGSEYALQVRDHPRQQVSYSVPEQDWFKAAGFNTAYGALTEQWIVPMWAEAQYVGAIANHTTALPAEVDFYDFRDESLALLYESPSKWQVIEIDSVGADVLNLLGTGTNVFAAAYLMPARLGHVVNSIKRNTNGHNVFTEVVYDVDDNAALGAGDAPSQFLSNDIYFVAPLLDGDRIPLDINARVDVVDYELGRVARRAPWLYNRVARSHQFLCDGPQEVRQFKQWLSRRSGRLRKYWEPSFEVDMRNLSTGSITTTMLIASDNYRDWNPLRTHIAVELDDGSWLPRTINSSSQINATQVQLTLATSLGVNASRIRRISYLGLKRLDTDRIEMEWIGNNVLRAAVGVVEVSP